MTSPGERKPLFLAISIIAIQIHEKVPLIDEMELMCGLQQGLLITETDLAMAATENQICHQQRSTLNPQYDAVPWDDQSMTWQLVDYLGPLPLWKWQHFVLTGIDIYSGYACSFPVPNSSSKTTVCGLKEFLFYHHSISCSTASDQGVHFIDKDVRQWPYVIH